MRGSETVIEAQDRQTPEWNDFSSCNGAVCFFVKANFLVVSILIVSMALKVTKKVKPFFFAFLFVLTFYVCLDIMFKELRELC